MRATLSMRSRRAAASRGLEAAVINTFPTLAYSEVKGLKIGKGALECAVCLNEFEDDETLRLLPKCDHVFHPECIDMWLGNHTTCPVCRTDLVPLPGESVEVPDRVSQPDPITNERNIVEDDQQGEVRVTITADENEQLGGNNLEEVKPEVMKRGGSLRVNRPPRSGSVRSKLFGNKFPRSHSTGHSLVQPGDNVDRFTLRLPEEVRKEIIKRALTRTGSCAASSLQCEGSARKGYRTGNGEGSSRGKSYRRLGSLEHVVKSDRWVFSRMPSFLSRALSVRSPKVVAGDGEASTSAGPTKDGGEDMSVKSTTGLAAIDSSKLPV